jgi:hypothetical protein
MTWVGKSRGVSTQRYKTMLREELYEINLGRLLTCGVGFQPMTYNELRYSKKREPHRGRCRVFRKLKQMGFSYPGIGMAAGFHHTTVLHGVRTAQKDEINNPTRVRFISLDEGAAIQAASGKPVIITELTSIAANQDESPMEIGIPSIA